MTADINPKPLAPRKHNQLVEVAIKGDWSSTQQTAKSYERHEHCVRCLLCYNLDTLVSVLMSMRATYSTTHIYHKSQESP